MDKVKMGDLTLTSDQIRHNLDAISERIAAAARKAGRRSEEITVIAVSKTHPASAIRAAYDAGVRHFGENRVQEWESKRPDAQDLPATWHLVGHLQSNKAGRAAALFHSIDSVDDFALAQRLDRGRAANAGDPKLRILLEVRVAPEETKSGVQPDQTEHLAAQIATLPNLELAGLMCIPPFLDDPDQVRPFFVKLRALRDQIAPNLGRPLPVLSIGMSHDYAVAIEEGATEVRIGTAIFGLRPQP